MSANFCMTRDILANCLIAIQHLPYTQNVVKNWDAKMVCKTFCVSEKLTGSREEEKKNSWGKTLLASLLQLFAYGLALFFALPVLIKINNLTVFILSSVRYSPRHEQQEETYFSLSKPRNGITLLPSHHNLLLYSRRYFLSQDWNHSHSCSGRTTLVKIPFAATYGKDPPDHWNHWDRPPASLGVLPSILWAALAMACYLLLREFLT